MRLSCALLFGAVVLGGCGDDPKPKSAQNTPADAPTAKKAPEVKFDLATLQAEAKSTALVPSPVEMQKALTAAGITTRLATMVTSRNIDTNVPDKNASAVRTGVVLADLVLSVKDSPTDQLVAQLKRVKVGLDALGGSAEIGATIDDMANRINNDAISRDDLVKELDELRGVMVPSAEYAIGEAAVPLILAGSWVEGAHLVAGAMKAENNYTAATDLLRQPDVVDYFLKYVQSDASEKAPDELVGKLRGTLVMLKEIAQKDALEAGDVDVIHKATGDVLALL